tara:strand:+ start:89 stop:553 length:465 start_codon:yes stop_codon:yes gene_type:complete
MEFENTKFKYEDNKLFRFNKKIKTWTDCSCLSADKNGYYRIKINNKMFKTHRLIYKLHNPEWDIYDTTTNNLIDHIDRNKQNNNIDNLRVADIKLNNRNVIGKGYCFNNKCPIRPYEARIVVNNKDIKLGWFKTEEEAHEEYLKAKLEIHKIKK